MLALQVFDGELQPGDVVSEQQRIISQPNLGLELPNGPTTGLRQQEIDHIERLSDALLHCDLLQQLTGSWVSQLDRSSDVACLAQRTVRSQRQLIAEEILMEPVTHLLGPADEEAQRFHLGAIMVPVYPA
jgi:hypothetical protein